jgi:hypothetical protein
VVSAVAVEPPKGALPPAPRAQRRALLEEKLLASGLAYGTGAADPAIELAQDAPAGARAFAQLVVGLLRTCAEAGALSGAPLFVGNAGLTSDRAAGARRAHLVALLAAAAGEAKAAAPLFARPLDAPASLLTRLAGKVAARLSRRFLAEGALFAGLPLHNGLCAIEVRTCATLALATFGHGRLSPAAAHLAIGAALGWRAALVELLAALAAVQERGPEALKGYDQVIRSQRLPAREARLLRRALNKPRPPEVLAAGMYGDALSRFALTQVLLAALLDGRFEPGEVAFVERLAVALGVGESELAAMETAIEGFYRQHTEALTALRLAETPEGLPHALTTRIKEAVLDNLDRMLQEIRETGELAELLAKAAAGVSLSPAEKLKVREQLIDLAKTIPALAIFAAPGGMILLPILLKLLPFNLLPSSFIDESPRFALPPQRPRPRGPQATQPPQPLPPLKSTSG